MLLIFSLVIIHDFHVVGVAVVPGEADAVLIVDADAVGCGAISFQSFELVSGGRAEIVELSRLVEEKQFAPGRPFDGLEPADGAIVEKGRSFRTFEGSDQVTVYDAWRIMSSVIEAGVPC